MLGIDVLMLLIPRDETIRFRSLSAGGWPRTALAEQKIGQAEREAVAEVRASAVDIAVEAARALLAVKVDAKAGADLFKSALDDVKAKLN